MSELNDTTCEKCKRKTSAQFPFCPMCGTRKPEMPTPDFIKEMPDRYTNTFGLWKVTTEGDEEGRSTRKLGIHEGHIDEIARKLAHKAFYGLWFMAVDPEPVGLEEPKREPKSVHIQMSIDSKTWDLKPKQRPVVFAKIFENRPVSIEESNYYASVLMVFHPKEKEGS